MKRISKPKKCPSLGKRLGLFPRFFFLRPCAGPYGLPLLLIQSPADGGDTRLHRIFWASTATSSLR